MAKDFSKYVFLKENYAKGQLVKAVVEDYIKTHKDISLAELSEIFPQEIQHATNTSFLFDVVRDVTYIFEEDTKRYFPEVIELSGGKKIRICNQWDKDNLPEFIKCAGKLGYSIGVVIGE